MVLGEHGFQSGEGRSRTEIGLPGVQQELLEEIYSVNGLTNFAASLAETGDKEWAKKVYEKALEVAEKNEEEDEIEEIKEKLEELG